MDPWGKRFSQESGSIEGPAPLGEATELNSRLL
jgi:hypothetical protein